MKIQRARVDNEQKDAKQVQLNNIEEDIEEGKSK